MNNTHQILNVAFLRDGGQVFRGVFSGKARLSYIFREQQITFRPTFCLIQTYNSISGLRSRIHGQSDPSHAFGGEASGQTRGGGGGK